MQAQAGDGSGRARNGLSFSLQVSYILSMSERLPPQEQDAIDHADKDVWREREGWATPEEAMHTLSGKDGVRFEFIED